MEREFTIQDLIQEVLKRWWLVATCAILLGALFFTYSNFFVADQFTSTGSVYVDNKATKIISSSEIENNTANLYDLTTAEMLVDSYIEILSSNSFFELIEKRTGLSIHPAQVQYERVEETGVIYIFVTAFTPEDAQKCCQAVLENANLHIMNIMEVGSVKPIDDATMPLTRSYPNVTRTTLLGILLGIVLSLAIIFVINYFDVNIKTVEDIEKRYDLSVLGTIPNMFVTNSSNGGTHNE